MSSPNSASINPLPIPARQEAERAAELARTGKGLSKEERKVIFASSLGTVFEWYDFYLYGTLATIIGQQFFTQLDPNSRMIFSLLAFAAGFIVRPFGSLVFGRLGDMIGRKHTFLITILIMGLSTFIVGCLPGYETMGIAAPILLIALRMLQGLALGGEYGGAATYVAEHAPRNQRGFFTSWIQTTATLGLFLSLLVILGTKMAVGDEAFKDWGWRIPFWVSALLVIVSVWIRLSMNESPAFIKMKSEGKVSKAPLTEAFGQWSNLKIVILALVGLTAGQAVVWYTGQFYALFFLTNTLKVDHTTANLLIAVSLLLGTPFFVVFGMLSDKIGRKPIIMAGCLIAALSYFPLFSALTQFANPALAKAQAANKIVVLANQDECSFQFNPTGDKKFTSSCDIAKQVLAANSASYETIEGSGPARIKIGNSEFESYSSAGLSPADAKMKDAAFKKLVVDGLRAAGYPKSANPDEMNKLAIVAILTTLVIFVTMVYGPIAAMLVEMFPTRIRYTSMSLPYHIGNGWFGGLLPATGVAIVAQTGNMYNGLWYPIIVAGATFVIGMLFIKETKDVDIHADH
jgi:MFS family permease